MRVQAPLFLQDNILAQPYHYDVHFHKQLKARLLEHKTPAQIIGESTSVSKATSLLSEGS